MLSVRGHFWLTVLCPAAAASTQEITISVSTYLSDPASQIYNQFKSMSMFNMIMDDHDMGQGGAPLSCDETPPLLHFKLSMAPHILFL